MTHQGAVPIAGALVCIGIVALLAVSGGRPSDAVASEAQREISRCRSAPDKAACYEAGIPALYPAMSVSEVFGVIREVRHRDPAYRFCHVLAHKLGERVVAEDPEKWIDAIPLNPADGLCSNGFVHGVTGGRFRSEVLSPQTIQTFIGDFTAACAPRASWKASDLDRAICYHGMGHLYDFITDADIPQSLALCSRTAPKEYERMCIEGVFMQLYQPLEPDDFELLKRMENPPTKETVREYCGQYTDAAYAGACLRESWPYFEEGIRDGSAAAAFCSGQPNATETEYCYQGASSLVGRMSLDDPQKALFACGRFPAEWRGLCLSYSAEAIIQEERTDSRKAVDLCLLGQGDVPQTCLEHLLSHGHFLFGDNREQYGMFCKALPPEYARRCEAQRV